MSASGNGELWQRIQVFISIYLTVCKSPFKQRFYVSHPFFAAGGVQHDCDEIHPVFAGGSGRPYVSTGTGVVLRAIEMEADVILLAKAIDGVYDSDPAKNPDAVKYDTVTIKEVVDKRLAVIDMTASIMCMENHMPLAVFGLNEENSIANALNGKITGTHVTA